MSAETTPGNSSGVAQGTMPDEPRDPLKAAVWQALQPFREELISTGGVTFMGLRNAMVEAVRPFTRDPAPVNPEWTDLSASGALTYGAPR